MGTAASERSPGTARRGRLLTAAGLGLLVAALGWIAGQWREVFWSRHRGELVDWAEQPMDPLQRLSYDVPFIVRYGLPDWAHGLAGPWRDVADVIIVYMDEDSAARLEQPAVDRWSRGLHARLLDRLAAEAPRAVLFDAVFGTEAPEDAAFAAALRKAGNAYLGAAFETNLERDVEADRGLAVEKLLRRNPVLYGAAAGWGLLTFRPVEQDHGVTRLFTGKERPGFPPWPALAWRVARDLGAVLPADEASDRFTPRWLNYYGPSGRIPSLSYYRLFDEHGGLPAGYFRGKVVLVGARSQLGTGLHKELDEFGTPWASILRRAYTPGAEIHATALLNLLHHDWLERLAPPAERAAIVLFGLALGALAWLRPGRAVAVALLAGAAVMLASCLAQWHLRLWWNWGVPVFLQLPVALGLAVTSRYYLEERRKRKLRSAFGFYLSPELADEIAERDFALAPGGEKVVATLVFTDLEGFTTLSEKLGDSAELGRVLVDYFTRTTDEILAEKGTVIKFIGDAVYAAWGAPMAQPDHAERAVRAAWRLSQVSALDVPVRRPDGSTEIVRVRTRVGIHTGEALAGNLGSVRRFDYTLIGDAVNFASRLEGVNKYTGTSILLSDDTAQRLGGRFLLRPLGVFRVKGRQAPTAIHELLGDDPAARPAWLDTFAAALADWTAGRLNAARAGFEAVRAARGGRDGPAEFYLARLDAERPDGAWDGTVALDEK